MEPGRTNDRSAIVPTAGTCTRADAATLARVREQAFARLPPAEGERLLEYAWTFDLPMAPGALWNLVSDTSRLNRALGLGAMHFEERDGVLHGSSRHGGLHTEWVEIPWSWVAGDHLVTIRTYSRGMAKSVRAAYRLEPAGEGRTRFTAYFGWVPRGLLGEVFVRLAMRWLERRYREVVPRLASEGVMPPAPPGASEGTVLSSESEARTRAIRDALVERGLEAGIVDRLVDYVHTGDELELDRIQVPERARAWGVEEDELLRVCLHATRLGLLDLRWDVICPHCRGVRKEVGRLADVPARASCEVCGIDFTTDKENAIEITFHVHPSIRPIERRFYCSAEPATKRHVLLQLALAPGEERTATPPLAPGRYRVRTRGSREHGYLDVFAGEGSGALVRLSASRVAGEHRAGPSPVLVLANDADTTTTFVVEAAQWSDTALRPGRLLTLQDFHDLFAEEYLAADVQLAIGEQTILFTDMVGSTAFYASRGDPAAFVEVKAHFDTLFAIVARHRGAVVKTIGDAVMAAFGHPLDAVRAAGAIHAAFDERRSDTDIRLRASLNTGPCIAVRLGNDLDFFGGTVNVAAKLQALAGAGDVAMSLRTYRSAGVREHLESARAALVDASYASGALPEPIEVKVWHTFGTRP